MATTGTTADHIDLVSVKDFETTVRDLEAALGQTSTGELMRRLAASDSWEDYVAQCKSLAGSSGLIEVGWLDWGGVLSLSGRPMKARCIIIGNPVTAQKLLSAGGAPVGLYLPAKMLVYEADDGSVHVTYDAIGPMTGRFDNVALAQVASLIDAVLAKLAEVAIG